MGPGVHPVSNAVTIEWQQYAYTVGRLKARLAEFPDDTPVIMSKDAEGNGYSPLSGVYPARYEATSTYSGEIRDEEDDFSGEDYNGDPISYAEYVGEAVPVVLLGPVN
jgi:hypothetical protein